MLITDGNVSDIRVRKYENNLDAVPALAERGYTEPVTTRELGASIARENAKITGEGATGTCCAPDSRGGIFFFRRRRRIRWLCDHIFWFTYADSTTTHQRC